MTSSQTPHSAACGGKTASGAACEIEKALNKQLGVVTTRFFDLQLQPIHERFRSSHRRLFHNQRECTRR